MSRQYVILRTEDSEVKITGVYEDESEALANFEKQSAKYFSLYEITSESSDDPLRYDGGSTFVMAHCHGLNRNLQLHLWDSAVSARAELLEDGTTGT